MTRLKSPGKRGAKALLAAPAPQQSLDWNTGIDGEIIAMIVAGVDEAGRGPLAGPVYAAAVILDASRPIPGLADSKILTEPMRDALALEIRAHALAWSVASASVEEIDEINILQATMLAMERAVIGLSLLPELVRVDGNRLPRLNCRGEAIVKGDATVPAISAASILAKTARDAELRLLHDTYPGYGFDQHKGYGTALHLTQLASLGPCPAHRRSFAPVRNALGVTMDTTVVLSLGGI
jgi:ribonuclease HII